MMKILMELQSDRDWIGRILVFGMFAWALYNLISGKIHLSGGRCYRRTSEPLLYWVYTVFILLLTSFLMVVVLWLWLGFGASDGR